MTSEQQTDRTPREGFIKPWEFWVVFFTIFSLGVVLGLYGQDTGSDALVVIAVLGTAALLTAYTRKGSQWVMSE